MATIPTSFIQDLTARADLVDIIGRYVTLKKTGANFKGLCPFHDEKSPSFMVSPVRQTYHCFGCGAHGDALSFMIEYSGLNFVEAVKDLAHQMGVQVPEENVSPEQRAVAQQRKVKQSQITDVLAQAAQHWQAALLKDQKAMAYVQHRRLSHETMQRFGLGYAGPGWQGLEGAFENYNDPLLVDGGLVILSEPDPNNPNAVARRYDRFRDRLMFPIKNVKGEVIGFGGRVLGQGEPKYLNSPETPVFSKGHELYGLYEARGEIRKHNYVLITEGYMDVVALAQHGFTNSVATLGTACTPEHMQKIFKFTDSIVFSFDGDKAGRRAARRALEIALPFAKDTRTIKFLFLPEEHDPDSYINEHGESGFKQVVAHSMPLSQFLQEAAREGCDLSTPEGRARMLAQAYPLWSQFPQGALSIQLLTEIAAAGQLSVANLQMLWEQQTAQATQSYSAPQYTQNDQPQMGGVPQQQPTQWQRDTGSGYGNSYGGGFNKTGYSGAYNNRGSYGNKRPWKGRGQQEPMHPPLTAAQAPVTPVQQCIRIMLIHSEWWENISMADQEMLCSQLGWHGAFFKWLERIVTDRGGVKWAALSEAARQQPWYEMMMILADAAVLEMDIEPEVLSTCLEQIRSAKKREESARILQQFKLR